MDELIPVGQGDDGESEDAGVRGAQRALA